MAHGLGKLLRRLRQQSEKKWTLAQLGKELGVGTSYLSKVENEEIEKLSDQFVGDTLKLVDPRRAATISKTIAQCYGLRKYPVDFVSLSDLGSDVIAINCTGAPPLVPEWGELRKLVNFEYTTAAPWFCRFTGEGITPKSRHKLTYLSTPAATALMATHAVESRKKRLKNAADCDSFLWGAVKVEIRAAMADVLVGVHVVLGRIGVFSTNGFDLSLSFDPERVDKIEQILATNPLVWPPDNAKQQLRIQTEDAGFASELGKKLE